MKNLEAAIISKNLESIKFVVHKMKSPLSFLGFFDIIQKLTNLETTFGKEDEHMTESEFNNIKDELQLNYTMLKNFIKVKM